MFHALNSRLLQRSFLMRLLQTTGLSLALMTASGAGVHAEDVTVLGAPGENGANGVNPGDWGGEGGTGGDATASASSADPLNKATAIGGGGGNGGDGATWSDPGLDGGTGGAAKATAATTVISGSAGADALASGGNGGNHGRNNGSSGIYANGGSGGAATAVATGSSGNGNATVSASATGGSGTEGEGFGSSGGDAAASSTAIANGAGDASSSANATGGGGARGIDQNGGDHGGNATATASASATGGAKAIATAVATPGAGPDSSGQGQATSNAETVNGAMARALSTGGPGNGTFGYVASSSTAKTSFAGVTTTATASAYAGKAAAIAQGGSAQTFVDPNAVSAISVALPDKAYATTLIGDASHVANALLGPGDEIFGASILNGGSSTFAFAYQGDLLLGVIDDLGFGIIANGVPIWIGDFGDDTVIDLSSFGFGGTIFGYGTFVFGGAVAETVPEASTWAMLVLGFAGLGFVGYRQTRGARPQAA